MNRTPSLILFSFGISLMIVGFVVWHFENMNDTLFKYSIEQLQFNDRWLNFTVCFIEVPKEGITVYAYTIEDVHQEFKAITFYSDDKLTLSQPLAEPISQLPKNLKGYLYTKELGIIAIQITD